MTLTLSKGFWTTDAPASDPYWENVQLLLKFDSTPFTPELSDNAFTFTGDTSSQDTTGAPLIPDCFSTSLCERKPLWSSGSRGWHEWEQRLARVERASSGARSCVVVEVRSHLALVADQAEPASLVVGRGGAEPSTQNILSCQPWRLEFKLNLIF